MIPNDWNQEEKRRYERLSLESYLRVFRQDTDELIGHIMDISLGGMMLLTKEHLSTGKHYYFRLELHPQGGEFEKLPLEAISVWGKPDANPDLYNTGFRFVALSTATLLRIQNLIDELSAQD